MSADSRSAPDPAMPPPTVTISAAKLAHDARNALTIAHARLQRLQRHTDEGTIDCAAFLVELDEACKAIRRAIAAIDTLESAAATVSLLTTSPPPERHPDD